MKPMFELGAMLKKYIDGGMLENGTNSSGYNTTVLGGQYTSDSPYGDVRRRTVSEGNLNTFSLQREFDDRLEYFMDKYPSMNIEDARQEVMNQMAQDNGFMSRIDLIETARRGRPSDTQAGKRLMMEAGGMMEYPGGGLMPKQYDNGGPLTRAEYEALAKQFEETGELTDEMKEIVFANMTPDEAKFAEDLYLSGRVGGNAIRKSFTRAIENNAPLGFNQNFRRDDLRDSEGEVTADNLNRKYDLYERDGEIIYSGEGRDRDIKRGKGAKFAKTRFGSSIRNTQQLAGATDNLGFPFASGKKRGYSTPEPEPVPRREDPVDPVTPREPVVVRRDPEPRPQRRPEPEQTFRAELPEVVITPREDPVVRRDRTAGIPMGDLLVMPSDYTGSGGADRATGPFAQQRSNISRLVDLLELENQNRGGGFPFRKKKRKLAYRR